MIVDGRYELSSHKDSTKPFRNTIVPGYHHGLQEYFISNPLTSQLTNGRVTTREKERIGIKTTQLQVDSTFINWVSNISVLDHVSTVVREAILLVDNDCNISQQNRSKSGAGSVQSRARHQHGVRA